MARRKARVPAHYRTDRISVNLMRLPDHWFATGHLAAQLLCRKALFQSWNSAIAWLVIMMAQILVVMAGIVDISIPTSTLLSTQHPPLLQIFTSCSTIIPDIRCQFGQSIMDLIPP